jgi:hypothetical protein
VRACFFLSLLILLKESRFLLLRYSARFLSSRDRFSKSCLGVVAP